LVGVTVAVNVVVEPTFTLAVVGDTVTPVTGTFVVLTVIADVAVNPPLTVVTVIVALPAATPDTTPAELTVATAVLLELHVTLLLVALVGTTVAVNVVVEPTFTLTDVGATVTPVTGTSVPPPVPLTSKCAQPTEDL
jgi:hypothetical protein